MQPAIINLFLCPSCASDIRTDKEKAVCAGCGKRFPFLEGHLFLKERDVSCKRTTRKESLWRKYLKPPGPCWSKFSHNLVQEYYRNAAATQDAVIMEFGSGDRRIGERVINVEIFPYPNVDVVIEPDVSHLPITDNSVDMIFCIGTLEHVPYPWKLVREFRRILKTGGLLYLEVPFIQGIHADPDDYFRFTPAGLRVLLEQFEIKEEGISHGPIAGWTWVTREAFSNLSKPLYMLLKIILSYLLFPFRLLDLLYIGKGKINPVPSVIFSVARKRMDDK